MGDALFTTFLVFLNVFMSILNFHIYKKGESEISLWVSGFCACGAIVIVLMGVMN